MEAAAGPASEPVRALLVVAAGVASSLTVFAGNGSAPVPLLVALPAFAGAWLALAAVGVGALPLARLDRAGRIAVAAAVSLTLWVTVSIGWSIAGDLSWEWVNRGLILCCFLVVGVVLGALSSSLRALAVILAGVVGAAIAWALLGVVVPALAPDADRISRLQEPVGYWNALALLADGGLAFAAWLLADSRRLGRAAGASFCFASVVVVLLTQSRAGMLAGLAVVAFVLLRAQRRLELGVLLLLAALPGLAVGGWAFTRPALVDDGVGRELRIDEAPIFGAALGVGLAIAVAAVLLVPAERLVRTRRETVVRGLVIASAVVVVAGVVGLVASVGNPARWMADQVGTGECANSPDRFAKGCDNNRLAWWGDALEIARDRPLAGSGAGTYRIARLPVRDDGTPVTEPHSVPLQLLADLGVIGLALGLMAAGAAAIGIRRALARAEREMAPVATVLAALPLAWGLHALVDYDLDLVAVTGPVALATGALLASARPVRRLRGGFPAIAVATSVVVLAVGSVVLPALSRGAVDDVYEATELQAAADAARRARSLDPLSLEAVLAHADVAEQAGDRSGAQKLFELATRMQPENPRSWLELARFHYTARPPEYCAAYEAFNEAYTRDPRSRRWVPGGPLDVSRAKVNDGACES